MADLGQNRHFFPAIIIPSKVFDFQTFRESVVIHVNPGPGISFLNNPRPLTTTLQVIQ